tara:strand:+ start:1520 stop:2089 length:570 start_codon:yes stop_codon:yes gene_type:complete
MTHLPDMAALSLNDPPNPLPKGWEALPDDVQKQVWDSVKSGDRGCQESRWWCNRAVNKAHAQWCRDNKRWLGRCDLLRIDIDESKLEAFPLSEEERSLAQALDGFMYIPTSADAALMHHSLMSNTLVRLLRLTPMPVFAPRVGAPGTWYVSPLAPSYKFFSRYLPTWHISRQTNRPELEQKFMVFVTKQ